MAALCLNFGSKAQDHKAIDITTNGLQIGQEVPNVTITNLHNYKDENGKPATTARLSDFKGKILILDFWATWCSPCVAMIPKMDSLQKQFGNKIQFISVTYQNQKEVLPFLEKYERQKGRHYDLPLITGDKELHKLFPHIYLPHYAWIDEKGMVKAITGYEEVTAENIQKMLKYERSDSFDSAERNADAVLKRKRDVKNPYDDQKPLTAFGNGSDGYKPFFQSVLLPYNEQIHGGYRLGQLAGYNRITGLNCGLQTLYQIAYGERRVFYGLSKTRLEVKDPEPITYIPNDGLIGMWLRNGHGYCYELLVDTAFKGNYFQFMQQDLQRFFPKYEGKVEKRKAKCYILVRTGSEDKLRSKGGERQTKFDATGCSMQNMYLQRFISQLESFFMQRSPLPFLNETGYLERVDMTINAPLTNIKAMNLELARYDLQFIEAEREVDMLIITDAITTTQTD